MSVGISVRLALVDAKTPLKALADISFNWAGERITICRCAVFEKPGEPPWANLPRLSVGMTDKRRYVQLIELSRALKHRALTALLEEYRRKTDAQ